MILQNVDMREEYDIRGGVRGKYYQRYRAMIAASPKPKEQQKASKRDPDSS